jgi:single-stranded-DNA-specific exonuclease
MKNNWILADLDQQIISELSQNLKIDTITAELLYTRKIYDLKSANDFLKPSASQLHSPFLMLNMYEAVSLVRKHIEQNSKIGVFCDSDLDGLTSLTVLNTFLSKLNVELFYYYPNEEYNDYGLTPPVTKIFTDKKIDLLITLDCGIRDVEEINVLKKNGIEVLVCDHHEPDEILPDCVIINPKQHNCTYPFKELAAVGVTFKLVQAIMYSYLPLYKKKTALLTKQGTLYELRFLTDGINNNENEISFYYPEEYQTFADDEVPLFTYNLNDSEILKLETKTTEKIESLVQHALGDRSKEFVTDQISLYEKLNVSIGDAVKNIFLEATFNLPEKCLSLFESILPFVAIGTIADVVSTVDENRVLISKGIECFNKSNDQRLIRLKQFIKQEVDPKSIAWQIAPLLNAPGRFGKTELVAEFITGHDKSDNVFEKINDLNELRKKYVSEKFLEIINKTEYNDEGVILITDIAIEPGVTGLLASRVSEHYNVPVIIASEVETGIYKGSGRSNSLPFYQFVEKYQSYFLRFGGHQQAFGFTIKENELIQLKNALIDDFKKSNIEHETFSVDLEMDYHDLTPSVLQTLKMLEPFGIENEKPLFLARKIPVRSVSSFGKKNEHGKILTDRNDIEIVGWRMAEKMSEAAEKGSVDLLYHPEINTFSRNSNLRMLVLDID